MSSLTSRTIAASYLELLKTASASGVTSVLTAIEDGDATASALQISTTGIQSSGTLNVVGPTTLTSTLIVSGASTLIGNVGITGNLNVTGNAVIDGLLTANGGTLTFGNADTDNVVFGADINSNILPNTDNTYDLGSAAKSWKDIHIDGTATINNLSITGSQTIPATTQSTDKDTGALVIEGGVGVEKNVNVGGTLAVTGTTILTGNVGIGMTPSFPLDISSSTGNVRMQSTTGTNLCQLQLINGSSTLRVGVESSAGGGLVAGSAPYSGVISNALNFPLAFGTNNTERLRIDSSGNVGIGTTSNTANSKLEVYGDSAAAHVGIRANNAATDGYGTLWLSNNGSNDGVIRGGASAASYTNQLAIITSGATPVTIATNNTERLRIDSAGATTLSSTLGVADTISATKASGTGLAVTANATVGGDLTVTGNLTINGTTTNINTTNLVVEDKNVVLADVATPTNTTADGGGITLKGATDKTLNWVNSTSAWTSSENVDVASSKTYKVNGADVLSNNTLGSGVTASSLTSVGTIGTGTWQGTIVNPTYGGTGVNNAAKTITLGGDLNTAGAFSTSGAFATTLTSTAATTVTLPTSGTLATLANTETLTNKTISLASNTLTATSAQIATAVSDETGTGSLVFSDSPALTGTPTAITAAAGTNTTQVATTAHVFAERSNTATLTNKTLNLTSNTLVATSAQLATAVTDETGSGSLVFATSPTLTTPSISQIVNTGTLSLPTSTDTLVGRATTDTLTNKTINLSSNTLQATSAELATAISDETGTGSLVFANSPTLVTPSLGAASATSLSLGTPLTPANGGTGLSTTSAAAAGKILGVTPDGSTHEYKTLYPGTGISIIDTAGVVTITNTGSGSGGGGGGSASGAVAIYRYNATAGQTVFSGVDTSPAPTSLLYVQNYVNVFLNGVKLDDSDFTATSGTSITLNVACVATDDVDIVAFGAVPQLANAGGLPNYLVGTTQGGTALEYKQLIGVNGVTVTPGSGSLIISAGGSPLSAPLASFRYTASANQTVFTGNDSNFNPLAFTPGFLYVFVNGILLAPSLDYTTTSTTTITLSSGCSLSDFVDILAFGQVTTVGLTDSSVTTAKINDSAVTTAKINNSAVTTAKLDQTAGSEAVTTATIRDGAVTAAKLAAGAAVPSQTGNSGKYLTTNGTTAAWQTSPVGFRNRIINGDMRIWQRGTTLSNPTAGANFYTADRWGCNRAGDVSGAVVSQIPAVLTGFQYALALQRVAANTSVGSISLWYSFESSDVFDLAGSSVTLSYWAKTGANFSGGSGMTQAIYYGTGIDQRIYAMTGITTAVNTSQALTSTWSKYTLTAAIPSNATQIGFNFTWIPTGTAGADDSIKITGVQLEAGTTATDFERRPIGTELALCQRYYLKLQPTLNNRYGIGRNTSATLSSLTVPFPVYMRVRPTALEQSGTASHYGIAYLATSQACTAVPVFAYSTELVAQVQLTNTAVLTAGQANEAFSANALGYLAWSAEL